MFDVSHIAKLARLGLSPADEKKFVKELTAILDFIGKLKEVNVDGVEPTAQVTGLENIVRVDEAVKRNAGGRQKILGNAPDRKGSYIKVKGIFE